MTKYVLVFLLFSFTNAAAQDHIIIGRLPATIENKDTIYFTSPGYIDSKYYQPNQVSATVINGEFSLKVNLDVPHMYSIVLQSSRGEVPAQGEFFIDRTTSLIKIDSRLGGGECNEILGETQQEFKNKFVPFLYDSKEDYDCRFNSTQHYRFKEPKEFDSRLAEYIKENPNSFVGLWMLIERFSTSGYSPMYKTMAVSFSDEMKQKELWKILYDDIIDIRILENKKFLSLALKTVELKDQKLTLPKAKVTLVDFWFSHCRPCLQAFPKMKELYKQYHETGFEIIGISVDRTKYIGKWQKVIKDKELDWPQYLDENGALATNEKIISFPTNFLLNEKGEVIRKNISLEELEELLKQI